MRLSPAARENLPRAIFLPQKMFWVLGARCFQNYVTKNAYDCEPFSPSQRSKTPRTPNLFKICPSDCFSGFRSRGVKFVKNLSKFEKRQFRTNFDKFLTNFSALDWNPEKQSLGQILDKFGVRGVFESCKGEKGSQAYELFWHKLLNTPRGRDIPAKIPRRPRFLSSKPKEDKVSSESTIFSATTPSHGRPPPHRAVSGPKKLFFVLFFLA